MRIATAVVGAGPAGLLTCVVARLLDESEGVSGDRPLWLFDKRDAYERTHRLRMDPAPYRAIARAVTDPRFDALIAFLEAERFGPVVNDLEARLAALASGLGVERRRLAIGTGPDEVDLAGLRRMLEGEGLRPDEPLAIVGADSVHSTIRDRVRAAEPLHRRTHQYLARLRIVGDTLPDGLGWVEQYKMSKVLSSLLDYRLNANGFAEVDLFLTSDEHHAVVALGATPRDPVPLDPTRLRGLGAPFFRRIVERAAGGFGHGPCRVMLQSTFRLEHQYVERVAYDVPDLRAHVFLVGDAAISLPFFRGMASLAGCALALARALREGDPVARYDADVRAIREAELGVVAGRAWLIRGAREFIRVSALLPFPMQTWLLSEPDRDARTDPPGLGFLANLAVAVVALVPALGAPLAAVHGDPRWLWLWCLAVPLHLAGGVLYAAARAFEGGPQRNVRAVWRWQVATALVVGVGVAVSAPFGLASMVALVSWFVLAGPFVLGLYGFEALDRQWWARASLERPH